MSRFEFRGPVYNSIYIDVLRQLRRNNVDVDTCCYIGARLTTLRDSISDRKNFRVKVYGPYDNLLVRINVSGGLKGLTRKKYRVTESKVERYDWLSKLWKIVVWVSTKVIMKFALPMVSQLFSIQTSTLEAIMDS
jgi:hypothetical protein